jgi:CBS domain containing-hemolysin-like protein
MSILFLAIMLCICVLLEGFFSGSEIAIINADRLRLAVASEGGSKRAALALKIIDNAPRFFSTTLLGTNLATVIGSVLTTLFIIYNYGEAYAPLAIIFWPFTLTFGEVIPKSLFQHHSDKIVLYIVLPLYAFSLIFFPFVWLLSGFTRKIIGNLGQGIHPSTRLTREDLEAMIEMGNADGSDVRHSERTMISRLFDLADKKVENIMTPLLDVIALPVTAGRKEADEVLEKQGFSRIPLYENRIFNMVGVLYGFDLIFGDQNASVRELMEPVYYVPEGMPLDELLVAMKRKGEPIAVVVDEYGAATGIVTFEDLMEEVVGEINDEHDTRPVLYQRTGKNRFVLSGRLEIEHANSRLGLDIPEGEYETIAGFVIHIMERIPSSGETFGSGKLFFKIIRATERAVIEVEVTRRA